MSNVFDLAESMMAQSIWRRARKEHRCQNQNCVIPKGANYIEYIGGSPAFVTGKRYCLDCAEGQLGFEPKPENCRWK